ncbi:MAG TPA: DUF6468 domain-containing protein [Alphaproteobacteria bacterium]|nr:DUF6468 domain-containing protein [Alphaproteobacteria bacterium]
MSLALATISCVLLALVAGLLLLLGQLLRGMRRELREAPLLAEKLAQQLLAVRTGLEQARVTAHKLGPDLGVQLQAAQTIVNDLKFLIARGEQVANRVESGTSHANGKVQATVTVTAEPAEAPVTYSPQTIVQHSPLPQHQQDPLESLLADLEEAAGTGTETVRRRPSQAEMELRAKERN